MCNLAVYATKTDAALRYIIKDASEAAINMQAIGDAVAECKYLDQVNDACTILARRKEPRRPRNKRVAAMIEQMHRLNGGNR